MELTQNVRQQIFPEIPLRYSGQTCWRGLVNHTLPDQWKNATLKLWGNQLRFGMSEMADEQIYWFTVKSAPENEKDETSRNIYKTNSLNLKALFMN